MSSRMSLRIARVTEADMLRLRQISLQTFSETFSGSNSPEDMALYLEQQLSETQLLREWSTPGSEFYFALSGEDIAGYLKVNTGLAQTEQRLPGALEIERIYVLSSFQGQGAGAFLMEQARLIAAGRGCKTIWLGVWEHNTKAIRFYEGFGFVPFDRHIFRLGNDGQTDIMMKLELD